MNLVNVIVHIATTLKHSGNLLSNMCLLHTKAAHKEPNISLQTAYTWKRNWNHFIVNEASGIYKEPKKAWLQTSSGPRAQT